jgi:hypothetical protein
MIIQQPSETVRTMRTFGKAQHKCDYAADTSDVPEPIRRPPPEANDGIKTTSPRALHKARSAMSLPPESLTQWQRRQRIRPKRHPSPKVQFSEPPLIGGSDAAVLGPFDGEAGLADSTRSLKHFACPQQKLQQPVTVAVTFSDNKLHRESLVGSSIGFPNAGSRAESVLQPAAALLCPPFPPTAGIAIRHEFVLEMSKKSKRLGRVAGGGADIMDSLVSSIDEIASTPMRSPLTTNGHHRHRSDEYESVIMVSPAPVIQTSKSSTRSPGHNKLSRRPSVRNSVRDSARLSLRTSNSQEHWLPPIEQEDDFLSGTSLAQRRSYSSSPSSNSARHPHPSIPTRTTSITLDTPQIHIPQRSNSLMHTIAPPLPSPRSGHSRRSDHGGDIPSYIHRYLHKSHSKENLDTLDSPRRSTYSSRQLPPRSRNSTTAIPGNDHMRLGKLSKRSSTQGFERDLAATRHYYSLPPPPHNQSRHSASLKPSRDSLASDGSSFSRVNSNYVQEVLNNPKLTQRIRLTSGRILSFSEVGDKNGWPVFCFTGMGLNRLVAGIA